MDGGVREARQDRARESVKRSIGRYRIMTALGKGAQSDVWVAFDLEDVVLQCLAKGASDRHACARDVRTALEGCEAAGAWTQADAAKFWEEDHRRALSKWTDETC